MKAMIENFQRRIGLHLYSKDGYGNNLNKLENVICSD
jgi:hypothetical protein